MQSTSDNIYDVCIEFSPKYPDLQRVLLKRILDIKLKAAMVSQFILVGVDKENENSLVSALPPQQALELQGYKGSVWRQRLVLSTLESIPVEPSGLEMKLDVHQSLISQLIVDQKYIKEVFVLHTPDSNFLKDHWANLKRIFNPQPIIAIRDYLGVQFAVYFSFLGFYTSYLIPMAILGVVFFFLNFFSFLNLFSPLNGMMEMTIALAIWAMLFLRFWDRENAKLTSEWQAYHASHDADAFQHEVDAMALERWKSQPAGTRDTKLKRIHPLRGEVLYEVTLPTWQTYLRRACSLALILVLVAGVFLYVWSLVRLADYLAALTPECDKKPPSHIKSQINHLSNQLLHREEKHPSMWKCYVLRPLPGLLNVLSVLIFGQLYWFLALKLNRWENHSSREAYQNNLIIKLCLFEIPNNFLSLFYLGVYMRDFDRLRNRLWALLVMKQLYGNLKEVLTPWIEAKLKPKQTISAAVKKIVSKEAPEGPLDIPKNTQDTELLLLKQRDHPKYGMEDLAKDYLEMVLQFGQLACFGAVLPLAPLFCLINNVIEIRSDGWKLVNNTFRRPFAKNDSGLGAWSQVIRGVAFLAFITNGILLYHSGHFMHYFPKWSDYDGLLYFIVAEHAILILVELIKATMPAMPLAVRRRLARQRLSQTVQRGFKQAPEKIVSNIVSETKSGGRQKGKKES
jgi:hypothetical protein